MPANIVPAVAVAEGPSLIIRLNDAVQAVKVHKAMLGNLARQCSDLLSTVQEHSLQLVGTSASAEADEIERVIERILKRVLVWVGYSTPMAFAKQNEIKFGIDECYRELTACSNRFEIALSLVDSSESRVREELRQRDQRKLYELLADLFEEVRRSGRSVVAEPPTLLSAPQMIDDLQQVVTADHEAQGPTPVVIPPRHRSTDLSGRVSVIRDHAVLEGRFLDFILGEWTNDGAPATLGRPRDQSATSQMRFKDKVESWHGLHHRNVLSFFGHVKIGDIIYSVSPWMENGNIREYVQENPDADRMRLLIEVASGMAFLHEHGIVHGDLCGKNVLISGDGKAFLCGFNLSEFVNPTSDASRARWLAPERMTCASVTSPTFKADVWSFGLLCLEVFTNADPYSSYSDMYVPVLLSQGKPPENPGTAAVGLIPKMWELMQSCWEVDPAVRPDMDKIQLAMRDILPRVELRPNVTARRPSISPYQSLPLLPPPTTNGSSSHGRSRSSPENSSIPAPLTPPPIRPDVVARRTSTSPAQTQLLLPTFIPPTTNGSSLDERSRSSSESSSIPAPQTPPPIRPDVIVRHTSTSPQLLQPTLVPLPTSSSSHERSRSSPEISPIPAQPNLLPTRPDVIARRTSTSPSQTQVLLPTLVPPMTYHGSSPHESGHGSSESSSLSAPLSTTTGLQLTLEPSTMTPPLSRLGEIEAPGTLKRGGNASSLTAARLPTLREDDHDSRSSDWDKAFSLSAPSQSSIFSDLPPSSRPSTDSSSSPHRPVASDLHRHASLDSSSSRSSTSTGGGSAPLPPARKLSRWLPPFPTKRSQSTTGKDGPATVAAKPPKTSPRSWTTPAVTSNVVPQPSTSTANRPILAPTRQWLPVSREVLGSLERVASDPERLLRPANDGSVSAGNLEGLFSRAITGSADLSRDERFTAAFLTIYQLFATSERLFEVVKRRFESTSRDPSMARSRYYILLFIESWLKKGFEDPELTCSSKIREFACSVSGSENISETMEEKAREIARLVDDPDYVRLRKPESCPQLRREPAPRPPGVTPSDVANALTVIEGNRFEKITYWDYVNFIRQRPNTPRIEVFNNVNDLIKTWVQRTVLGLEYVDERIKKYEFWVSTAQACRKLKNFSSTSAIVTALISPIITSLTLTCESRTAKQVLHGLAKELSPTDGSYRKMIQSAATKELIPCLDPHLTSLNSTFAQSDPIVEVDGHPLIDFKQLSELAEQVNSIVQYTPPRIEHATRQDVLASIEYSLESSTGGDALTEALSAKLAPEERKMVEARARMRSLGFPWSPPRRKT